RIFDVRQREHLGRDLQQRDRVHVRVFANDGERSRHWCESDEGDEATECRLATHEAPGKTSDCDALIENTVDLTTRVFDVDDLVWEQVVVHDLDIVVGPDLFERSADGGRALPGEIGSYLADDSIHRVIGAASIDR